MRTSRPRHIMATVNATSKKIKLVVIMKSMRLVQRDREFSLTLQLTFVCSENMFTRSRRQIRRMNTIL